MTVEKLCKSRVYFKVRRRNPYRSLIKQKIPKRGSVIEFRAGSEIEGQNLTQNSNKTRVYPFPKKDIL
jgi:hypothetical protein